MEDNLPSIMCAACRTLVPLDALESHSSACVPLPKPEPTDDSHSHSHSDSDSDAGENGSGESSGGERSSGTASGCGTDAYDDPTCAVQPSPTDNTTDSTKDSTTDSTKDSTKDRGSSSHRRHRHRHHRHHSNHHRHSNNNHHSNHHRHSGKRRHRRRHRRGHTDWRAALGPEAIQELDAKALALVQALAQEVSHPSVQDIDQAMALGTGPVQSALADLCTALPDVADDPAFAAGIKVLHTLARLLDPILPSTDWRTVDHDVLGQGVVDMAALFVQALRAVVPRQGADLTHAMEAVMEAVVDVVPRVPSVTYAEVIRDIAAQGEHYLTDLFNHVMEETHANPPPSQPAHEPTTPAPAAPAAPAAPQPAFDHLDDAVALPSFVDDDDDDFFNSEFGGCAIDSTITDDKPSSPLPSLAYPDPDDISTTNGNNNNNNNDDDDWWDDDDAHGIPPPTQDHP